MKEMFQNIARTTDSFLINYVEYISSEKIYTFFLTPKWTVY